VRLSLFFKIMSDLLGVCAASKSAMEVMAETLRLELAPFAIYVVSVVTTGGKTSSHVANQAWKVLFDSNYLHVEKEFLKRAKGDDAAPRMEAMDYARRVVDKVIGREENQFWCGAYAGMLESTIACPPVAWMVLFFTCG
jgi:1-acylglycerone phosphate reductase